MSDRVRLSIEGSLARLTLCAPERRNAIDAEFARQWSRACADCAARPDLALIVLAAEGDMFSVGGDIAAFVDHAETLGEYIGACVDGFHAGVRALRDAAAPTLLLLGGTAAGGAFSIVCGADMVIARGSAKLVSGYTRSGLTPDGGLSWLLPRLIGARRAFEVMATNRPVAMDEARALGLVARVAGETFEAEAEQLVGDLAAMPSGALASVKRLLGRGDRAAYDAHLDAERDAMIARAAMPDTVARLRAFICR